MCMWHHPMAVEGSSAPMAVSTSPRSASPGVWSEVGAVAPQIGWAVGVLSVAAAAAAAAAAAVAAAVAAEAAVVAEAEGVEQEEEQEEGEEAAGAGMACGSRSSTA